MWTFARFLPLVVGHKIPERDEHWENLLCFLDIMNIVFAPGIAVESCGYLESICLRELYPNEDAFNGSFTPADFKVCYLNLILLIYPSSNYMLIYMYM